MSDELRHRFEESLEGVPVPPPCVSTAKLRGAQRAHRRLAIVVMSAVVLLGTAGWVVGDLGDGSRPVGPSGDGALTSREVDMLATRVIDHLGPECRGFDFYYKSQIAGHEYRTVQCGLELGTRRNRMVLDPTPTARPTPTPRPTSLGKSSFLLVKGPRLNIYAFGAPVARDTWLSSHPAPWGGRFAGPDWVVDVMDRDAFGPIGEELSGSGARILDRPSRAWRLEDFVLKPLPVDYEPKVSLRRATRRLPLGKETLGAQIGAYSSRTEAEPVPAWVVTVRNCVEQYGGSAASEDCVGDQTHFVINARSGRLITTFST